MDEIDYGWGYEIFKRLSDNIEKVIKGQKEQDCRLFSLKLWMLLGLHQV